MKLGEHTEYGFEFYDAEVSIERRDPMCNRCRSTDVRWRQQGGKWVLFSLTPGLEHRCPIDANEFGAIPE